MRVTFCGVDYVVEEHEDYSVTIDGKPLTRLGPDTKAQYALETEILVRDGQLRDEAQRAINSILRRACGR